MLPAHSSYLCKSVLVLVLRYLGLDLLKLVFCLLALLPGLLQLVFQLLGLVQKEKPSRTSRWNWWQPAQSFLNTCSLSFADLILFLLSFLLQLAELLLGLAELLLGFGQFLLHILAWSSLTSCFGGLFLDQLGENTKQAVDPRDETFVAWSTPSGSGVHSCETNLVVLGLELLILALVASSDLLHLSDGLVLLLHLRVAALQVFLEFVSL